MANPARALVLWVMVGGAASALAAEVSIRITSEATIAPLIELSSEGSSRASSSSTHDSAEDRRQDGARCKRDSQCLGRCVERRCVDGAPPPQAAQCAEDAHCAPGFFCRGGACVAPQQSGGCAQDSQCAPGLFCRGGACVAPQQSGCAQDSQCAPGLSCRGGACVSAPAAPQSVPACREDAQCAPGYQCIRGACSEPPGRPGVAPSAPAACTTDQQCAPGQTCVNGQCLTPPPEPSPMLRRGTELYLRERLVELREDLATGSGPVIAMLASAQRVPAAALGRVLRAHRAELLPLMNAPGPDWAGDFLLKVEQLLGERNRAPT